MGCIECCGCVHDHHGCDHDYDHHDHVFYRDRYANANVLILYVDALNHYCDHGCKVDRYDCVYADP